MTQLKIAGVEAVLPQGFSCTVKRENSFFTKSGEYTYDVTLRLDNPVNSRLYGFLNRVNKSDELATDRPAELIADGHVYCRGKEVITRWTEETVTIQIVSGESELNYFIGQDRKMSDLNLGEITSEATEVVWPLIRTGDGLFVNIRKTEYQSGGVTLRRIDWNRQSPSPYLCTVIARLMKSLGYEVEEDQLQDTPFARLIIVNRRPTRKFAEMIGGWTVKDFLGEVERLTGVVFLTDNLRRKVRIVRKTRFYLEARQLPLRDVVDAYEVEVDDADTREEEFTASNVGYDLPDGRWAKLMRLPEYLPAGVRTEEYATFEQLRQASTGSAAINPVLLKDASTGRTYIRTLRTMQDSKGKDIDSYFLLEVDTFADLKRDDTDARMELKMTPAPMSPSYYNRPGLEFIDLGTTDGYYDFYYSGADEDESQTEVADEYAETFEQTIRQAEKKEAEAGDLYCAFYDGVTRNDFPQVYTDAYHAMMLPLLYGYERTYNTGSPEGSLRLKDLDGDYYQGGYQIDTRHATTFETFDPNVIDPRQVYVVQNRRYVVRDTEEVITAEGRQKKWKLTCYPITVSDEAIEKRWVLTKGVWDDGAAWLDDGRWNDEPN